MNFQRILVPTDFSIEAQNATDVAVQIAKKFNAQITLLHVIDVPVPGQMDSIDPVTGVIDTAVGDPSLYKSYVGKLSDATAEQMRKVKEKFPRIEIKEHIVYDSLAKHLADFVLKDETDLIVVGSKGASSIDEVLIGSNTERIIRYAKTPVLVVKKKVQEFRLEQIVFASSFSKVPEKVANTVKELSGAYGAMVHLVKVITPNTFEITPETENGIREFALHYGFENYTASGFNYFSEEEGIQAFAENKDADMIVMVTHGRKGISHLLLGSIAEAVANHTSLPLMTFNSHIK